ncbi:hypothetical protein ACJX0J_030181, partial [Zea mays]
IDDIIYRLSRVWGMHAIYLEHVFSAIELSESGDSDDEDCVGNWYILLLSAKCDINVDWFLVFPFTKFFYSLTIEVIADAATLLLKESPFQHLQKSSAGMWLENSFIELNWGEEMGGGEEDYAGTYSPWDQADVSLSH